MVSELRFVIPHFASDIDVLFILPLRGIRSFMVLSYGLDLCEACELGEFFGWKCFFLPPSGSSHHLNHYSPVILDDSTYR